MKPNNNQHKVLKTLLQQIAFWSTTNDIDSPTHTCDIDEQFAELELFEGFTKEELEPVKDKLIDLYYAVKGIKGDNNIPDIIRKGHMVYGIDLALVGESRTAYAIIGGRGHIHSTLLKEELIAAANSKGIQVVVMGDKNQHAFGQYDYETITVNDEFYVLK